MLLGCSLLAGGCSSSDDASTSAGDGGGGGGGDTTSDTTTFSCGKPGKYCVEYTGSEASIARTRESTKCTDQGGIEGTGCPRETGASCTLPTNGSTGTGGAQFYYGTQSDDDLAALKRTCEQAHGTFAVL